MNSLPLKNYLQLILVLSLGLLFSIAASAEEKGLTVLTLDQALQTAMEKNKDIQKAKEYRNQVEGRYRGGTGRGLASVADPGRDFPSPR